MKFQPFNSVAEVLMYVLMILLLILNVIGLAISADNASQAKKIASQNQEFAKESQQQTIDARKANADRQNQLKDYTKCIVLLKYDNPALTAASPRADVEAALDKCANK